MAKRKPKVSKSDKQKLFWLIVIVILILLIISPIDLIPDVIPVIGWLDDIAYIAMILGIYMKEWG